MQNNLRLRALPGYGRGLWFPEMALFAWCIKPACGSVASYGAKTAGPGGVAQRLERVLTAADMAHDVKEYPEAGHSFLNNPRTWWFNALQVIHISATNSRRKIRGEGCSFFSAALEQLDGQDSRPNRAESRCHD